MFVVDAAELLRHPVDKVCVQLALARLIPLAAAVQFFGLPVMSPKGKPKLKKTARREPSPS